MLVNAVLLAQLLQKNLEDQAKVYCLFKNFLWILRLSKRLTFFLSLFSVYQIRRVLRGSERSKNVCCDRSSERVLKNVQRTRLSLRRMIWLLPHRLPTLKSVSSTGDTQEDRKREATCSRERRGRSQIIPNYTAARKPSPL